MLIQTVHEDDTLAAPSGRWLAKDARQPLATVVPH
jgi:hypothetical protein